MATTVYSKNDCINCEKTKGELDARGVSYEVINMSLVPEALKKVKAMGFRAAPVVVTEGDSWSGYDLEKIEEHWPAVKSAEESAAEKAADEETWDF